MYNQGSIANLVKEAQLETRLAKEAQVRLMELNEVYLKRIQELEKENLLLIEKSDQKNKKSKKEPGSSDTGAIKLEA